MQDEQGARLQPQANHAGAASHVAARRTHACNPVDDRRPRTPIGPATDPAGYHR